MSQQTTEPAFQISEEDCISAVRYAWSQIKEDSLRLGKLKSSQACEIAADYVTTYYRGDHEKARMVLKKLCAMAKKEYGLFAKKCNLDVDE